MEHITQQSLAFDRADAFEQNEDAKNLLEQEAKLLEEINTFKDALVSAQSDLTEVQRKLRIIRKKHGVHKTLNQIIYDYVQQNPGKRYIDIVRYMEEKGLASGNAVVSFAKEGGVIKENLDGTFSIGVIKTKRPYGSIASSVIEYARNNGWFRIKDCFDYLSSQNLNVPRHRICNTISNHYYKDRFDIDRSGKFIKYRLKDEYRSL